MNILLLAGTAEARALSHELDAMAGVTLTASLAGVTQHPAPLSGAVRVGGFGGVEGLAGFVRDAGIGLVIDATHPFAAQMSTHAVAACERSGVPILQVVRPPWDISPHWQVVPDLASAAAAIPLEAIAFLATGRASVRAFAGREDVTCIVRVIDKTPAGFPLPRGQFLVSRPPFTIEQEVETLRDLRVDTLVVRNSGGVGGIEKIRAAEQLGLRIIMVGRPVKPDAPRVATVEEAVAWVRAGSWSGV